jgi:hypothetical protein
MRAIVEYNVYTAVVLGWNRKLCEDIANSLKTLFYRNLIETLHEADEEELALRRRRVLLEVVVVDPHAVETAFNSTV